jgi:tetratricopeptide (TPR) repeat protein
MTVILLFVASLLPKSGLGPAMAAELHPAYQPNVEYYLNKIEAVKKQGFLKDEIRNFRSYPHLDKAYRLQRDRRLKEARKEFVAYLSLKPEDIRSRVSYMVLLDKMSLNEDVITQADVILDRWPAFIPAYFFKGQAYQKLGKTDRALIVFTTAASGKDIQKGDRVYALSTAVDLALSLADYADAGKMLPTLAEIDRKHAWYMKAGFVFEKTSRLKDSLDAYSAAQEVAKSPAEKIAASLALAEVARKLNMPERVRQAYETALGIDSGNQAALRGLANMAYAGNRYDEAEKWMLLLEQNGLKPQDREFLANLYLKRQDYAAAIQELRTIVDSQGKKASAAILASLAQTYESAGRYQESAAIYGLLLEKTPESGEMQLRYGNLLVRLGKFGEARPFLKKALLLGLSGRQKSVAHENLALIYEKSGSYENAAEELKQSLINQPPPGGELMVRLALLLNRAGKAEEALHYLDKALAEPTLTDELKQVSYMEKSAIFEKAGQASRAADELEKALKYSGKIGAEIDVRLAVLLNKAGRPVEALGYFDQALADPALSNEMKRIALREKGLILEKAGWRLEAASEYEKAVALGDNSPEIYLILANLYQPEENPKTAFDYLTKVINHPRASNQEKCSAEDGLGMNYFKQGRMQEAASHFNAALRRCGESWQRRYSLGLVHYRLKQWEQALEQFLLAFGMKKDPASLIGIALCQKELKRPGAAIHYLKQALQEPVGATPKQLKLIYETLGYLYAEEFAYDLAAEAFTRSQAYAPDTDFSMKLANVLNLAGKTDEAYALYKVDEKKLSPDATIEFNDLKSGLLQKLGRNEEALVLLEKNQKLHATASRSYELGILCQKTGHLHKAIEYFQAAYEKEPQQDDYAFSLGYAYAADGRFSDAIGMLEVVAARTPDSTAVLEELGYLNSKIVKNEQAVQWFKMALDSLPLMPLGSSEETDRREKEAYRIRSEITKLTKTFNTTMYASYRTGKSPSSFLANGVQISGGLNGQIGLETSYRPPAIGFRDERILELFGRVFGNLNPNSLNFNDDSTQAGIGLRYKFLQKENLWISCERLFKVGKGALDDWLLRLLYSRGKGFEPQPLERNQDYYLLYTEIDEYLRSETTAAYGEVRKGRSLTFSSSYMLIPHLVMDARWQSPFNAGGNYFEGGAGVSVRSFLNSTHFDKYRSAVDFTINYKHGKFFNQGFRNNVGDYDSALLSLGFSF